MFSHPAPVQSLFKHRKAARTHSTPPIQSRMCLSRAPPAPTLTTLLNQKRASPTLTEPDSLITPPASITESIASRYSQIHNQGNTSIRTVGTRLQIQVDFNRGLWNFCLANKQVVGNCWMPGACFDQDKCKDGCGFLDRKDLSTEKSRLAEC